MQLDQKTIIITGASSGIGAAAACTFARAGANLVLGARRAERLDALVARISGSGARAVALAGDVKDDRYNAELVALARFEFGGLDGAFNNAGIMGQTSPVPEMDTANWHAVLDTNLTSAFLAAKHQIPALKDQGRRVDPVHLVLRRPHERRARRHGRICGVQGGSCRPDQGAGE